MQRWATQGCIMTFFGYVDNRALFLELDYSPGFNPNWSFLILGAYICGHALFALAFMGPPRKTLVKVKNANSGTTSNKQTAASARVAAAMNLDVLHEISGETFTRAVEGVAEGGEHVVWLMIDAASATFNYAIAALSSAYSLSSKAHPNASKLHSHSNDHWWREAAAKISDLLHHHEEPVMSPEFYKSQHADLDSTADGDRVTISFKGLAYKVPVPASSGKVDKQLLDGVDGMIRPSEMVALMGASGGESSTSLARGSVPLTQTQTAT